MASRNAARSTSASPPAHAGAPLRARIPSLRAPQAEALRALCAAQRCWPLQNDRMLALAPLRRQAGAPGTFELDGDGTRMAVRFDRNDEAGTSPQWSDYAGRSRLLAWSLTHEQTLVQLSEALGAPLLPVSELPSDIDANDGDAVWLSFSIEDLYEPEGDAPGHYRSGDLRLPAAWLSRMLGRAEPLDPEHPLPDLAPWSALPAPVSIVCPGPTLSSAAWSALRLGDVVVLGSRAQPSRLHASANGRRWPLKPRPDGCEIVGDAQTLSTWLETATMQQTPDAPVDAAPAEGASAEGAESRGDAAARALPVLVEFELGRLELTLGELAGLQPGYVFALPAFVEGANVTIRANGRATGRGELVAVGDTLGVRLVSWS